MTARELIQSSLRLLRVLASGEAMQAAEAADGLEALNHLIDSWRAERLTLYAQARTTKVLTPGTQRYTIGTGGAIAVDRPLWLDGAGLLVGAEESPIDVFNRDEWALISDKAFQSTYPSGLFYNATFPLGAIDLWPVPTEANTLVLYHPAEALTSVASLATAISQPPGWGRALKYNLAVELAPEYGVEPSGIVFGVATDSKAAIKRPNQLEELLTIDPALVCDAGSLSRSEFDSGNF